MNEYINKTKLLEQLNSELSEISIVHHDHIDLEKQMYEFAIKKVEENRPIKFIYDDVKTETDNEGNITITRKMLPVEIAEWFDVPVTDVLDGTLRLGVCISED